MYDRANVSSNVSVAIGKRGVLKRYILPKPMGGGASLCGKVSSLAGAFFLVNRKREGKGDKWKDEARTVVCALERWNVTACLHTV